MKWYLITNNQLLYTSLSHYCKYNAGIDLEMIPRIAEKYSEYNETAFRLEFKSICDQIDELKLFKHTDSLILVDEGRYSDSGGSDDYHGELFNALMFTYPELCLCILKAGRNLDTKNKEVNNKLIRDYHYFDLLDLKKEINSKKKNISINYSALFDPTGIRNSIKQKYYQHNLKKEKNEDASPVRKEEGVLPDRKKVGLVIDDEKGYSFLYSYISYLKGYNVWNINTLGLMREVLKLSDYEIDFSFEDIFLSFYDKGKTSLILLKERDKEFKELKNIKKRTFISVNHKYKIKNEEVVEANNKYKCELRKLGTVVIDIEKPVPSIYKLLNDCKIKEEVKWPLMMLPENGDHSSPGKIVMIAERMLFRAEAILKNAKAPEDYLIGAMIAREVQELLCNSTPTLALRALLVREQLEVSYECLFQGIQYKLHFKDRIRAVEEEVESISLWYSEAHTKILFKRFREKVIKHTKALKNKTTFPSEREKNTQKNDKDSRIKTVYCKIKEWMDYHWDKYKITPPQINALSSIVGSLTLLYRNSNQFDEEHEALNYSRWLEGLSIKNKKWFYRYTYLGRWYLEKLLKSGAFFIVAVSLWALIFASWAYFLEAGGKNVSEIALNNNNNFWYYFTHAIESMFAFSIEYEEYMLSNPGFCSYMINILPIIVGFLHMGIFISHIYNKFLRK